MALAARYEISDVRVFGSCVTGADYSYSDINLVGTLAPASGYFEVGAFVGSVERMTGYPVDFVIDGDERPSYLDVVEMVPLVEEPEPRIAAVDFGRAPWSLIAGFKNRRVMLVAELRRRGWLGIGAGDANDADR
ncbi:hypothetical protein AB1K56_03395 [Microbacterium sp. BWR-S6Y]|uniref:nucleotidyltransferase family protein n=1 Tax=Microbacterium sp. BWR-S6Y TaxID=3232073 RepID=UPI0035287F6D